MHFKLNDIEKEKFYNKKLKAVKRKILHFINTGCKDRTLELELVSKTIVLVDDKKQHYYIIMDNRANLFSIFMDIKQPPQNKQKHNNAYGIRYSEKQSNKLRIKKQAPKNLRELIIVNMEPGKCYSVDKVAIELKVRYKHIFNEFSKMIREGLLYKNNNIDMHWYHHNESTATTYTYRGSL